MAPAQWLNEPISVFALLKRRADLDFPAFSGHWRTVHAKASMKLTKFFDRYVQNHIAEETLPGFGRAFDGGAELWYPDWSRSMALGESEEYRSDAYHDNFKFQDVNAMRLLITREVQVSPEFRRPFPGTAVKAIVLWRRRSGLGLEAFRERFTRRPHPLLLPEGRYVGFSRAFAIPAPEEADVTFDGVEQFWWRNEEDFRADLAALARHGIDETMVDRAASTAARVEELYIYWP